MGELFAMIWIALLTEDPVAENFRSLISRLRKTCKNIVSEGDNAGFQHLPKCPHVASLLKDKNPH